MENEQDLLVGPAFSDLTGQIGALHEDAGGTVTAGHLDLGPDLWLSTDPGGSAMMACGAGEQGINLSLEAGDSGGWASLGMRLPVADLRRARYLGLMVAVAGGGVLSFTPTLRYFLNEGGHSDVPTPAPVFLPGGPREHLSYIPLDPDRLNDASGCELNLFFHMDGFAAEFSKIEPLLIL